MEPQQRFQRYVDGLCDADALVLHRIVCRRASAIYGPMYAERRLANWRLGMSAAIARRGTPGKTPA